MGTPNWMEPMILSEVAKLSSVDKFLYWIAERHRIHQKKQAGERKPWTDDSILQTYKFCNVRRMNDRVSQWLFVNWYKPYKDHHNSLYACALARHFNNVASLGLITKYVYREGIPDWRGIKRTVTSLKRKGQKVFAGAYIIRGTNGKDKITAVVDDVVRPMAREKVEVLPGSMEGTYNNLVGRYGIGSFMAGQIVADLRWAVSGEWADRNSWAPMGPGSARGLARLLYGPVQWVSVARGYVGTPSDWLFDFVQVLVELTKALPRDICSDLEAMDYQNCLCEYDKYCRTLAGEGRPKQLYPGKGG